MHQLFISHAEEDADLALGLAAEFEKAGYCVWYYERDTVPGLAYLAQVGSAIEEALIIILIISPDSVKSTQVDREVVRAFESGKEFIPVLCRISHEEFQRAQPSWRQALGAVSSVKLQPDRLGDLVAKLKEGLRRMGVVPRNACDTAGRITSLAVLPLLNLSGDPGQEYFADGITELLCAQLGRLSALRKVTSRTTIMQYKGTTKRIPEIASELGVDAIIEGSVQREGNSVLVSIQLIAGPTDRHLWATSYEREVSSLLKLETDLAQAIASEIRIHVTPEEERRLDDKKSFNPGAVDAYLKGRSQYWSPVMHWPHLQTAEEHYKEALKIDPECAWAHAGLAEVYVVRTFNLGQRAKLWLAKAKESAQQALACDDFLAEAHTVMAWVKMMLDWDWSGAEDEIRRAIRLNPSHCQAHSWYGSILTALGRFDEASAELKRGQELDPLSPLSNFSVPAPAYMKGDYAQALKEAHQLLDRGPQFVYARFYTAAVYLQQGKFRECIAECLKLPDQFWEIETEPILAQAYALSGDRTKALTMLERLKGSFPADGQPAYSIASLYAVLGDTAEAIRWLDQAYVDRSSRMHTLAVNPIFRRLHLDSRFSAILKKMNLQV